jgi:tetratricopeptide (TPR) repeat protein
MSDRNVENARIASARAFLEAGNLQRALTEIEGVLRDDPHEPDALQTYCDTLLKLKRLDLLEQAAWKWLGHDPSSLLAYSHLLYCFKRSARRKDAEELRQRFLGASTDPQDVKLALALYDVSFGSKADGWAQVSEEFSSEGRHAETYAYASRAARARGDMREAWAQAKLALGAGYRDAHHLEYMSVLCFRLMRFAKCREFARLALRTDPHLAIARELLVLSWLVWFPPFLVAHVLALLRLLLAGQKWVVIALVIAPLVVFAGPAVKGLYWTITFPATLAGIPDYVSLSLFAIYLGYTHKMLGSVVKFAMPSTRKSVELKDY